MSEPALVTGRYASAAENHSLKFMSQAREAQALGSIAAAMAGSKVVGRRV